MARRHDQARWRVRRLDGQELRYWDALPDLYADAARRPPTDACPRGSAAGSAGLPGLAVNRRERTADGRTILGWNPDGVRDDSVVTIRMDGLDGRR